MSPSPWWGGARGGGTPARNGVRRAHCIGGDDAVTRRVAQRIEPALAAVRMQPALGVHALRVGPLEQVTRPARVIDARRVGGPRDMRLAPATELDLGTGAAVGARDQQHRTRQWATAAAAASSIRRPVRKRSRLKGALMGCGSALAMVCANT